MAVFALSFPILFKKHVNVFERLNLGLAYLKFEFKGDREKDSLGKSKLLNYAIRGMKDDPKSLFSKEAR